MGQKEVDELRSLIIRRAEILNKLKKAKGKAKVTLETELATVRKRISALDENQN